MKKFINHSAYLVTVCILLTTSVFANQTTTLDSETRVQGTTFQPGSILTTNSDGYLLRAVLGADQTIMDENYKSAMKMKFPKGTVLIYNDPVNAFGRPNERPDMVKEVRITGDVVVGRITFLSGSTLYVTGGFSEKNGKRNYFANINGQIPEDMKVGGTTIPARSNVMIEQSGKIKYAKIGSFDWVEVK